MSDPRIILASQSPRRHQLLNLISIAHDVVPSDVDESVLSNEAPAAHAERLAREKAMAASRGDRDAVCIGADTIVVIDGTILGKPRDEADARRMLRALSGRTHTVLTAVAVARNSVLVSGVEEVAVTFRPLDDADITAYVTTREPMDKAGAYGIQGFGATIVQRIEGDYFAVMGLALGRLITLLREVGVRYDFGRLVV